MTAPLPHLIALALLLLYPTGFEPLRFARPGGGAEALAVGGMLLAAYGALVVRLSRGMPGWGHPAIHPRLAHAFATGAGLLVFAIFVFILHAPLWIERIWPSVPLAAWVMLALVPHFLLTGLRFIATLQREQARLRAALSRLRFFFGFTVLPLAVALAALDALERFPAAARALALVPAAQPLAGAAFILLLLLAAPFAVRTILGAAPLGDSALRRRFDALAHRLGFRARNWLVIPARSWPVANAFIVGLIAPARYVFFTEPLLSHLTPEESAAVLAHEIAHARRHHLPALVCLLVSGIFLLSFGAHLWERLEWNPAAAPLAAAYLFLLLTVAFVWVSRRFESEADLVGAASAGSSVAYARALERVAQANGARPWEASWRHFSVTHRTDILFRADLDAAFRDAYLWRCGWIRVAIFALSLAGFVWHAFEVADQWRDPGPRAALWDAHLAAGQARRLAGKGRLAEALETMEEAIRAGADTGEYRACLAIWLFESGNPEGALIEAASARARGVRDPELRMRLEAIAP